MTEELFFQWAALGLVFANGFLLARAIYSPKMPGDQRLPNALTSLAMAVLFAPNAIKGSANVYFVAFIASSVLLFAAGAAWFWSVVRRKTPA